MNSNLLITGLIGAMDAIVVAVLLHDLFATAKHSAYALLRAWAQSMAPPQQPSHMGDPYPLVPSTTVPQQQQPPPQWGESTRATRRPPVRERN